MTPFFPLNIIAAVAGGDFIAYERLIAIGYGLRVATKLPLGYGFCLRHFSSLQTLVTSYLRFYALALAIIWSILAIIAFRYLAICPALWNRLSGFLVRILLII